ncbi:hypothetical protein [Streptantibioticus ferralitis]|uniref:Uncharacterized protein n=1 Tax=Streptantibioticus ferralitis TaxID=236510 RepID=A0ABT5Z1J6_9ACTN|nr:hypothetical protein [Streptantibioticus ferralitis]MDF2257719.1 hypothetical protein [Streptantibioticus ferralitis]
MYLVHARLESDEHTELPADTSGLVTQSARPGERLQHAVMHTSRVTGSVLGLFLLAATLEEAERTAATLCQRVLDENPELRRFRLASCGVAMPSSYYERMLRSAGTERPPEE